MNDPRPEVPVGPPESQQQQQWVLYIAAEEPNSVKAIEMVNGGGSHTEIKIVDVLTEEMIPDFVDGAPILFDASEKAVYRGSDALRELSRQQQPQQPQQPQQQQFELPSPNLPANGGGAAMIPPPR